MTVGPVESRVDAVWAANLDGVLPQDRFVLVALATLEDDGQRTCRHEVAAMTGYTVDQVDESKERLRGLGVIGRPQPRPTLKLVDGGADT